MKVSELTKRAKKFGCHIKRHGAEHDIWINPKTGNTASIPRHKSKEIATGTAQRIIKDLGLS
ncbi:MAG: type II toxin-antitoxin system HicA family toxin [Defluviitaleaceae bacterium]|nr:type II toxin-antitoxin system HicA family toxin [Defluviitaleaceae bacterium]MCL2263396.1 type II toxin-antitoxin system HicA family toxin [Defluviitaleaceae bacterium]